MPGETQLGGPKQAPSGSHPKPPHGAADLTAHHVLAVSTVISTMTETLDRGDSLTLALRRSGYSPFHFRRVFRAVTGTTPGRFLTALRLHAAKAALATTDGQVSNICFDVGYRSQSAFTTQFTRLVGIPPGRFRRLVDAAGGRAVPDRTEGPCSNELRGPGVALALTTQRVEHRLSDNASYPMLAEANAAPCSTALVGLFASDIPQGIAVSHLTLHDDLTGRLGIPPKPGRYDLFAMAVPARTNLIDLVLDRVPGSIVAHHRININASVEQPDERLVVQLRSRRPIDPPIVSSAAAIQLLNIGDVRTDSWRSH